MVENFDKFEWLVICLSFCHQNVLLPRHLCECIRFVTMFCSSKFLVCLICQKFPCQILRYMVRVYVNVAKVCVLVKLCIIH